MTANALAGEAERCLAAGMDDYLSKPVDLRALAGALRRWLLRLGRTTPPSTAAPTAHRARGGTRPAVSVYVRGTLAPSQHDEPGWLRGFLLRYLDLAADAVRAIEAAVTAGDADAVRHHAHRVRSSSRAVGAAVIADGLERLDAAGKQRDWAVIREVAPKLGPLLEVTRAAMAPDP